jgi:transcriptional regulator with GAF, ATPase, and Fis domain
VNDINLDEEPAETIRRQAQEIDQLRLWLEQARRAEELQNSIRLVGIANALAVPPTHEQLLEWMITTAAQALTARSGAIFLIDYESQELVFATAIGPKASEVRRFRVPLGHGIAGLVAISGQPMAVADAEDNPQQASDIARAVGYIPHSILCVPLTTRERIIGVLEVLDKETAPSFDAADIRLLTLFASLVAVAIQHSGIQINLINLIQEAIAPGDDPNSRQLRERARVLAGSIENDGGFRRMLDLATLIRTIAARGEHELQYCEALLQGFADYLHAQPVPFDGN